LSKNTKDIILESAISLFNTQGFSGTSIRDIAGKARVNVAHISYYFKNKRGLLEYCFTDFFEGYIKEIENGFASLNKGAAYCLKQVTKNIIQYLYKNTQLTRFVLREISIDSQIVREVMATYLMKEKYFLNRIFEEGMRTRELKIFSIDYSIIQFKGLLYMPFLNTDYLSEVLYIFPHESYFAEKYMKEIYAWIDGVLLNKEENKEVLSPVVKDGKLLGVLDIDSPSLNRFDELDQKKLEEFVSVLAEFL